MSQTPSENFEKRIITGGSKRGEAGLPSGQSVNDFHGRSDVDASLFSQHHTLGTSRTQASPGDHIHDGISSKFVTATRRTTADQTKWSVLNVEEDVTGLFFDADPNAHYLFQALIFGQSSVAALTYQFAFTLPVNGTIQWTSDSLVAAGVSGSVFRDRLTSASPTTPQLPIGTTAQSLIPKGVIFSGNGGRIPLRMKKLVATAGTLTVFADSTFEMRKIAA